MNKIIQSNLVTLGFKKIFSGLNRKEALKVMEANEIDLIISDWNMRVMNSLALLKETRKK